MHYQSYNSLFPHGALSAQGLSSASAPTTGPLTSIVNGNDPPATIHTPKAGINWILFDEQFRPVKKGTSGYESDYRSVSENGNEVTSHTMTAEAAENGYLYVYCSNESNVDVYFDNLQVVHTRGPLTEENSYYPFGLTMGGISSKALEFGGAENKKLYQGYEKNNDFDLTLYESFYRIHDPQLGRFWQADPKAADEISLYAAMDDNPVSKTDFLGDLTHIYNDNGDDIGTINTKNGNYATIVNGDNAGAASLIVWIIQKLNIKNEKLLGSLEDAVRGVGDNYDLTSFENFWDQNNTKIGPFTDKQTGDITTVTNNKFTDEQTNKEYKETAELYGNLVEDGNVVRVGKGRQTDHSPTTGSPGELPNEANRVSYIHTHPDGGNGTRYSYNQETRDKYGNFKESYKNMSGFIPGGPSPNDLYFSGQFKHRSVVVDANHIYLMQGNEKKLITIERHK